MGNFKEKLQEGLKERFAATTDNNSGNTRIVKYDVFQDDSYVIANVLDPRFKTTLFGELSRC